MANIVYIGTSLDGYISDKHGCLDWLNSVPNPDNDDFGFAEFMDSIDALVMGRITFETVLGFDGEWPYNKPVFVASMTLKEIPKKLTGKVELIQGDAGEIVTNLNNRGFKRLYIDGGKTIQTFLKEDLVDEMIISQLPILLGAGVPLFSDLNEPLYFELIGSKVLAGAIVQSHYRRKHP